MDTGTLQTRALNRELLPWIGLLLSAALFLLGSGFWYENVWKVPDVLYSVLPSYPLDGKSLGAITVQNAGRSTAHGVTVYVGPLDATIERLRLEQKAGGWTVSDGGEGWKFFELKTESFATGSKLTVYVLLQGQLDLAEDDVEATFEEGRGRPGPAPGSSELAPLTPSLFVGILISAGVFVYLLFAERQIKSVANRAGGLLQQAATLRDEAVEALGAARELQNQERPKKKQHRRRR